MRFIRVKRRGRFSGDGRGDFERLRTRRMRIRRMSFAAGAVVALIMFVGIAWGSYQPRFQIANIETEGQIALAADALTAKALHALSDGGIHIFSPTSMFFYPKKNMEAALLAAFPRLKSVSAHSSFGTQDLMLTVVERTPFAHWCAKDASSSGCYVMDERGYIFATSTGELVARGEIYSGGLLGEPMGQTFLPTYFSHVTDVVDAVKGLGLSVVSVEVINDTDYHVILSTGTALYIKFAIDALTIASNLRAALSVSALHAGLDKIQYIDLRFGDRLYYKNKIGN